MNHYGVKGEAFQYKAAYDSAGCKVTKFIQTVYNILQTQSLWDIVCWSADGSRFIVKKPREFSEIILQKHFGHKNISSFIRQLYFYDFKRCASENNQVSFSHPYFTKDSSMLSKLRRKNSKPSETSESSDTITEVPEKRVLVEKSEETWKSIAVQSANLNQSKLCNSQSIAAQSEYFQLPYDNIDQSLTPKNYAVQTRGSEPSLINLLIENSLVIGDALKDLRSLREKLERDNAEPDYNFELDSIETFDTMFDSSNWTRSETNTYY